MSAKLVPVFLRLDPTDIALVKFLFESYEGVAIIRTLDRRAAIIVVLASSDFLDDVEAIVTSLGEQLPLERIAAPADAGEDWLLRLLWDEKHE